MLDVYLRFKLCLNFFVAHEYKRVILMIKIKSQLSYRWLHMYTGCDTRSLEVGKLRHQFCFCIYRADLVLRRLSTVLKLFEVLYIFAF